jgi:xylan 1,4-beta-xylosidase
MRNLIAYCIVAVVVAPTVDASAAADVQVVAVVQDFEGENGDGWTPTGDAAVGRCAGMTEQVFAGGWNGFTLRISEVPADADGISFWVRTGDGRTAAMTLGLYQWQEKEKTKKPVDAWGAHLWATPNWQKYTFPFNRLATTWNSEGDGKFHKERVKSIQWQRFIVEGRGLRSARVMVDQIEFVKNTDGVTIGRKPGQQQIVVDASKPIGTVPRFWRAISPGDSVEHNPSFEGADGAAMRVIGADRTFDYARLCWAVFPKASPWLPYTYGGPIYSEDASGKPVYDWKGMDTLVANVLKCRLRPMMLLHTVPKEMAVDLKSGYGAYYCCPPKDYDKWRSLVRTYVQHYADKYGKEEVGKWYWEIWNEPDLWWQTWKVKEKDAGPAEYMKMYDYAAAGITDVLGDKALLGSPTIAGYPRDYSKRLLEHCTKAANNVTGRVGSPLSILTHHCYGAPFEQMAKLYAAQQLLDAYAPGRNVEIHVTEYAPTIWGRSFGTRYQAASLCQAIDAYAYARLTDGAKLAWLYWFGLMRVYSPDCDAYFIEPHAKAKMQVTTLFLNVKGTLLAKPVYNAYRMLNRLDTTWLDVSGASLGDKVRAFATVSDDNRRLAVVVYNHNCADSQSKEQTESVQLVVKNLPFEGRVKVASCLIDSTHSDVYSAWEAAGSPAYKDITIEQVKQIKTHDSLEMAAPETVVNVTKGATWSTRLTLDPNSVALFVLSAQ